MTVNGTWLAMERRRSQVEQVRENTTRPGRAYAHYQTVGTGATYNEPTVFEFGMAFIDLPIFNYGASLVEEGDLITPPHNSAGVYKWKRNGDGFYTGAWVYFAIGDVDTDDDPTGLKMLFHLSWDGVASKDFLNATGFPVNLLDL